MSKPRVSFLGLGLMGSGMARRLLDAGFPLTVYNRSAEKAQALAAAGARIAASPRDAASGADIVITMVADDAASRGIWLGENGALAGVAANAVCVECSTVSLGWVTELAGAVGKKCDFLDAPVTGSKMQAAGGELNFLVGGSSAALEKVRPVLAAMSKSITHLGPTGSGMLVKLINNFVCGVQVAAIAEALAMIEHSTLDREKSLQILLNGAPGSPMVKIVSARMTAADFTPNFMLSLMTKDLTYAVAEARKLSVDSSTGAAALKVFQNAIAAGYGGQDIAAVVQPFRKQ